MRVLVLQRAPAAVRRIEDDQRRVVLPRCLLEHGRHRRHELPDLLPELRPAGALQHAFGVAAEPVGLSLDDHAVVIEAADEERHVHEVVVVRLAECPGLARGAHSGRDLPVRLGADHHGRAELERTAFRIRKDVRAVEHHEIAPGPCHGVVELVRPVAEPDRDPPAAAPDTPGVGVELVPPERAAVCLRGELQDALGEVTHLVGAGSPHRERQQHRIVSCGGVEAYRDAERTGSRRRRVERDLVRDVGDRGRAEGSRDSGWTLLGERSGGAGESAGEQGRAMKSWHGEQT